MNDLQMNTNTDLRNLEDQKLPLRDWFLLPALSLFTIVFLFVALRLLGNHLFSTFDNIEQDCLRFHDNVHGIHGIPNTVCKMKLPESEPQEFRFNSCGHRSPLVCSQKAPNTFRIVTIGSSYVFGHSVAVEQSFTNLLTKDLSLKMGRNIEVYNEGLPYSYAHTIDINFNDVLAPKPDMIFWPLTPFDVQVASRILPPKPVKYTVPGLVDPGPKSSYISRVKYNLQLTFAGRSFVDGARAFWDLEITQFNANPIALMFRHYLYMSQSLYLKSYLLIGEGDHDTMYLRSNSTLEWQEKLKQFDAYLASISIKARAANVPLVVSLIPQRGQTAMLSMGTWPNDVDPWKLDNELRAMVMSHGGTYIDILPGFSKIPNPEQYYLPVDGHPIPEGNVIIANLLTNELTSSAASAFNNNNSQQNEQELRK